MTCNLADLPAVTGVPVVGIVPAGVGKLAPAEFTARAPDWFGTPLLSPHNTVHSTDQGVLT
ncbi:dethiobiotin synthetase, partial [Gordonia effusa NBRC 100432]